MRSMRAFVPWLALAVSACGSSGTPANTDGGSDRAADMRLGSGGAGGTTQAGGGGAGGAHGGGGAVGTAGGGGGGNAGTKGGGGHAGTAGAGGVPGGAGMGGAASPHDGGVDSAGCASSNPDPCLCGRPDANSLSASECAREKACQAAGGVWEPYFIFFDGGSYPPRCQAPDGAVWDAY